MMLSIEFQSLGAAAWNNISPFFGLVGGMTSSLCEDERNKRPGLHVYGIGLRAAGLGKRSIEPTNCFELLY